jgi:hypothetical protein
VVPVAVRFFSFSRVSLGGAIALVSLAAILLLGDLLGKAGLRMHLFFHHSRPGHASQTSKPPCATMEIDWGSEEVRPSHETALEAAPKPFSALFDKLSPYSGIFYI